MERDIKLAKGLIDLLLDSIFDDEWKGKHGEKLTERELKLVQLFGRKGKVLRNVYLPKDNGETSELDVIFITQREFSFLKARTIRDGYLVTKKESIGLPCCPISRRISSIIPLCRIKRTLSGCVALWEMKYHFFRSLHFRKDVN